MVKERAGAGAQAHVGFGSDGPRAIAAQHHSDCRCTIRASLCRRSFVRAGSLYSTRYKSADYCAPSPSIRCSAAGGTEPTGG
jgi:hypothetical protein